MAYVPRIVLLLVLADFAIAAIFNGSFLNALDNDMKAINATNTRRNRGRSTSSSSREKKTKDGKDKGDGDSRDDTLELSISDTSSSSEGTKKEKKKNYAPKSSRERTGWRKWHRKCTPCPEEMRMKWRDPRIKWICGAYQRARRSFKSICMMHYRNCQDGTMFVKIADHRCSNATELSNHGDHFFYDYKVELSDDSSGTTSSKSSSETKSSSSETESWSSDTIEDLIKNKINVLHT